MRGKMYIKKIACLIIITLLTITQAYSQKALEEKCKATDPCWPKAEEWAALHKQVGGRLIEVKSFLEPCKKDPQSKACQLALQYAENPYFIEEDPSGTQFTGYFKAWNSEPSTYAIAAENVDDIVAGVNFAQKHNVKTVIKGTGHDYLGRSSAPDSLLIWTHRMRNIQSYDSFVPTGCPTSTPGIPAVM